MATEHNIDGRTQQRAERPFESKLSSAFADTRGISHRTVQDVQQYADEIQNALSRLEEHHLRKQDTHQAMMAQMKASHEQFNNLVLASTSALNQLIAQRTQVLEAVEGTAQSQSARMKKIRKNLVKNAQRWSDEKREQQRLMTDTTAYIKHYKSLIAAE
ncbi:hypothetical protein SCLCIDRAFT_30659 [Scleroderma citrinum Foug A]|uniref:Uncharacterized protein n=1 Tax=Scleroderma citrinum Foug A TaxID=1036808 RepID=A0A0C2YZP5_9AGAM|nr:hypothetical protein SCLCIDRAFT_30659 [Scleroderma citrinum Foug A]